MSGQRTMEKRIATCFPGLTVSHAERILTGWDNIVLEVNDEYIFRFPRFKVSEAHLRKEIEILPFLRRHLQMKVPEYEFVWRGGRDHLGWFGGYKKIPGIPLTPGGFRLVWTERLAQTISGFLRELHDINAAGAPKAIPRYTPTTSFEYLERTHKRVSRLVYPLLAAGVRRRTEIFWKSLLDDLAGASFRPALIHGDLTSRNMLFDPANGTATGILDWGDSSISDPALDFAGLFEVNKHLGERALELYGKADGEFRRRVDWYVRLIPFYEILWGVEQDWERFKEDGMRRLEHRLRTSYVRLGPTEAHRTSQ